MINFRTGTIMINWIADLIKTKILISLKNQLMPENVFKNTRMKKLLLQRKKDWIEQKKKRNHQRIKNLKKIMKKKKLNFKIISQIILKNIMCFINNLKSSRLDYFSKSTYSKTSKHSVMKSMKRFSVQKICNFRINSSQIIKNQKKTSTKTIR